MVVFGSFLPSSTKKNPQKTPSKLDPLWQNFLDPRMMALRPKTFVFQATCNFKIDSQGHQFNPFMPNEICHPYQFDKSILNLRVVG